MREREEREREEREREMYCKCLRREGELIRAVNPGSNLAFYFYLS